MQFDKFSKTISEENLNKLLSNLSKEYNKLGGKDPVDILIVGGAAIVLNFSFRKSTIDIDADFSNNNTLEQAIKNIAINKNIPIDWLNNDFKNTPSYSPKLKSIAVPVNFSIPLLNISVISNEFLIAMKIKSSRPASNDLDDIEKMVYELRLKNFPISYKSVLDAFNYLYDDYSNVQDYFLKYLQKAFEISLDDVKELMNLDSIF